LTISKLNISDWVQNFSQIQSLSYGEVPTHGDPNDNDLQYFEELHNIDNDYQSAECDLKDSEINLANLVKAREDLTAEWVETIYKIMNGDPRNIENGILPYCEKLISRNVKIIRSKFPKLLEPEFIDKILELARMKLDYGESMARNMNFIYDVDSRGERIRSSENLNSLKSLGHRGGDEKISAGHKLSSFPNPIRGIMAKAMVQMVPNTVKVNFNMNVVEEAEERIQNLRRNVPRNLQSPDRKKFLTGKSLKTGFDVSPLLESGRKGDTVKFLEAVATLHDGSRHLKNYQKHVDQRALYLKSNTNPKFNPKASIVT
jgi:hypothetical protein